MDDSLKDAGAVISLSRDELEAIVGEAVAESRTLVWRGFCFVLLLLAFAMFVGCVVVRDQVRARTADMRAEISELRNALERAEMLALSGRSDGVGGDWRIEVAHESDRDPTASARQNRTANTKATTAIATPSLAAPMLPRLSAQPAESDGRVETGFGDGARPNAAAPALIEPTLAPVLPLPVQMAPPVRDRRPFVENESGRGKPQGDDGAAEPRARPSNRGVTIPSPIKRHESNEASAQRVRLSVGRGISFAPKRRPDPDVVVIRPDRDVLPVVFEREASVR